MVNSTATRKIISIFLCNILAIGTITAFFPTLSMTQVNALSDYGGMMMKNNYDNNDNYKSAKYSSFKKDNIECNNVNLNLNGLDVNVNPEPLEGLLQAQAEIAEGADNDASTFYNGAERHVGYQDKDKDFTFFCINNNDNEFILPVPQVPQIPVTNVCTVWQDDTPDINEIFNDIFFSGSHDDGETFSEPLNISKNTNGNSMSPHIKCDGNNVYVVWRDSINDNFDIFFSYSHDGGQTFSEPDNLSNNTGFSFIPEISSKGNNVYVVWRDGTAISGNFDIFFSFSRDGGQTFSEPDNLSNNTGFSVESQISTEGNNVYVVWRDETPISGNTDIFFSFSHDGGQTFSEPDNLSNNIGNSFLSEISTEGNNVYVVWTDEAPDNNDIFFARSIDGGQTFSEPDNISENTGNSFNPQISTEGNNVYAVWDDDTETPGIQDIYFARSIDGGQTFSEPDNISENTGMSIKPQISTEGNNVYVVWTDDTPIPENNDVFFARSIDGGQTFSEPDNLSENTGNSFNVEPQISTERNNVYVIWEDSTSGIDDDIFFARSTNGGQTFSSLPDNLSNNIGHSVIPQISSATS